MPGLPGIEFQFLQNLNFFDLIVMWLNIWLNLING
jgi:hypothetical protein